MAVFFSCCMIGTVYAEGDRLAKSSGELADLTLEELAGIQVTSVSKRPETLADAPASIFVISGEDIRRSAATTLPEALRLAPNLQVARVDARNYAISARGFNSPFENKILVLIDGRTVYSPLFSGVFWDVQDVVLEDILRIEVISGPGATLWGANAVNGVINIITKPAVETQGVLASAGASRNQRSGAVRYGGTLSNGGHYRVYGKHASNDDSRRADSSRLADGWTRNQTGFRSDWQRAHDAFMLKGDVYDGKLHQLGTSDIRVGGANLTGRMQRQLADGSELKLDGYVDYTERDQPNAFHERLTTINLELQHIKMFQDIHTLTWGAGYRLGADRVNNGPLFAFLPGNRNLRWIDVFVQDEIALRQDLRLTAGLKLENNSYTGTENLPSVRLAWKPSATQLVWGAASRSVRAPSRIDRDFFAPTNPLVVNGSPQYAVAGGPDFVSEVAKVVELGYRVQPTSALSYSTTIFHASYDRLRTLEPNPSGSGSVFLNKAFGRSTGIEMWTNWHATPAWHLSAGFVAQRVRVEVDPDSRDMTGASNLNTNDPSSYWMLRSSYDISARQEFDVTLRRMGALPRPVVPAYTTIDMRYGWKISRELELSVIGQNLLESTHAEYGAPANRSESERSVFLKLTWRL